MITGSILCIYIYIYLFTETGLVSVWLDTIQWCPSVWQSPCKTAASSMQPLSKVLLLMHHDHICSIHDVSIVAWPGIFFFFFTEAVWYCRCLTPRCPTYQQLQNSWEIVQSMEKLFTVIFSSLWGLLWQLHAFHCLATAIFLSLVHCIQTGQLIHLPWS